MDDIDFLSRFSIHRFSVYKLADLSVFLNFVECLFGFKALSFAVYQLVQLCYLYAHANHSKLMLCSENNNLSLPLLLHLLGCPFNPPCGHDTGAY